MLKFETVLFLFFFLGSHGDNEECLVMESVSIGKVEEWCCHGELKKKRSELETQIKIERCLESWRCCIGGLGHEDDDKKNETPQEIYM